MELTAYCHRLAEYTAIRQSQRVRTSKMLMVMKLTAIILLAACLQVSARGLSQTLTLSFKNASLEKVLHEIQKQTGYSFFYEDGLLKNAKPVDITVIKATIVQVLDICFTNQPFTYKIVNNAVSVRRKEQIIEASFQPTPAAGDPVTVSGKVTDPKGNPLSGANVKVKGTNIGTTTDNLGRFTLANLDASAVLEVSFVGHDVQVISIKGKNNLIIALNQKQSILDETVVIAYGTTTRRFTTGNVASIKAADIEMQPVQNPLLALQGRIPGVEITQLSGMSGGGVTVRVQGRNSINSGLDPLIVIDGVPYPSQLKFTLYENIVQGGSPLNYIDPANIESIEVLKDADATAIYGSRAANGAILITTKKGKVGRTKLNINLQKGWGKVTRRAKMMNTQQYLEMRNEAFKNDGLTPSSNSNATAPSLYAPDLMLWDTTRYTDWQKVLIGGTAEYTNIGATISGGTSLLQYLVGATYNKQTTVFPGNFDDKMLGLNFHLNSSSANKKFRVQLSGSYSYDQNQLPGFDLTTQSLLLEPIAPALYDINGALNWETDLAGNSTWINPLAYTTSTDFYNTTKRLVSNANLSYRIWRGLEIGASFGYTNLLSNLFLPRRLEFNRPERRATSQRIAQFGKRDMSNWIIEPQVTYTSNISKGKIEVLLGGSLQKNSGEALQITGSGFSNDYLMKSLRAATSITLDASPSFQYKYNAIFCRLNFNWNNKYIINLSSRRDGSSRFGEKNKFHNFGSIGVGWIFSDEALVKQALSFLSFGKLRASYGTTGNDQIDDYGYNSIYIVANTPIPYQSGGSALLPYNIPNPHLKWEETHKLQTGLDLGFLSDRIVIGVVYARNRSSNQLIGYKLPGMTGFSSIIKNFPATIQNTSWEFMINTINVKGRDLSWTSSVNLTIPRNKLLSFPNIEETSYGSATSTVVVGQPLGLTRVYIYSGVDPVSGKHQVFDRNGSPTVSPNLNTDRVSFIAPISNYYGGVINSVSYKRFKLDFLIQYVRQTKSKDLFFGNGSAYPGAFVRGLSNQPITALNRWRKVDDVASIARYSTSTGGLLPLSSDIGYGDEASFVRLKNVSFSWDFPTKWVQKAKLQNCYIYFRGENLATITKYSGLDPETGSSVLPPLQMWTIGLRMEL